MLTSGIAYLLLVLSTAVNIYLFVLFSVRVLLTWFPNIDFSNPVLSGVASITDPYLNMFRGDSAHRWHRSISDSGLHSPAGAVGCLRHPASSSIL